MVSSHAYFHLGYHRNGISHQQNMQSINHLHDSTMQLYAYAFGTNLTFGSSNEPGSHLCEPEPSI